MSISYCNREKIGEVLKTLDYRVNKNPFEFMSRHETTVEEYIIKIQLLSLLENYRHIIYLRYIFKIYCNDYSIPELSEIYEIVNRSKEKRFWGAFLQQNPYSDKTLSDLWRWELGGTLDRYCFYYIDDSIEVKGIPDDEIEREKDKEEILKELLEILRNTGFSLESFNTFIMKNKEESELKSKTNNDFLKSVSIQIRELRDCSRRIDKLKRDLIFNLCLLLDIFNTELFLENDLSIILKEIRSSFKIYMGVSGYGRNDWSIDINNYGIEYRDFTLKKYKVTSQENQFWLQTTEPDDIPAEMDKLFEEFKNINDIEDDEEYAKRCYLLSQRLLQIHPYKDGNGRTSKYLLFVLLLKRNILPLTVTDSHELSNCYNTMNPEDYFSGRTNLISHRCK